MLGKVIIAAAALLLAGVLLFAMSVAWFTNVAQTGGLRFRTQAFGFDSDKIKLDDGTYAAYPGAGGYISLAVDNSDRADGIRISVGADRSTLEEELQKRIFFYVDTAKSYSFPEQTPSAPSDGESTEETVTVETVQRVYLGASADLSYTYLLGGGEKLRLGEDYCSDAPLKWRWVYDVLGYYFRGTVSGGKVSVEEYLRPVEYELDSAVFESDATKEDYGAPVRIGTQSRAEFVRQLMQNDGFRGAPELDENGAISAKDYVKLGNKIYYKVMTQEDGSGVWLYLCDLAEIEAASAFDNAFAENTELSVTVKVTVSNEESQHTPVATEQELLAGLESGGVLTLQNDIALAAPVTLEAGQAAVIDLCDYDLAYTGQEQTYNLFTVSQGASLKLLGGTLTGNGKGVGQEKNPANISSVAVQCTGGEATLSGVTVRDFDGAVQIYDCDGAADSTLRVLGCDFETAATPVSLYGNGSASAVRCRMVIEGSRIKGGYFGIAGNGRTTGTGSYGTELTILHSEIIGNWVAIYHPQQASVLTVADGSTLTGYTALVLKGGSATLYDTQVSGTGEWAAAKNGGGGFTDTGGGIYIEATYDWSASVKLAGTKNKVESKNGYALEVFGQSGKGPGRLIAERGTFTGGKGESNTNGIGTLSVGGQ